MGRSAQLLFEEEVVSPLTDEAMAARLLQISEEALRELQAALATIRPEEVKLTDKHQPQYWQNPEDADLCEVLLKGTLLTPEGLETQYHFVLGVRGGQRGLGSNEVLDDFIVTTADEQTLFDDQVAAPADPDLRLGYNVFKPVREAVIYATSTQLMTGQWMSRPDPTPTPTEAVQAS